MFKPFLVAALCGGGLIVQGTDGALLLPTLGATKTGR